LSSAVHIFCGASKEHYFLIYVNSIITLLFTFIQ